MTAQDHIHDIGSWQWRAAILRRLPLALIWGAVIAWAGRRWICTLLLAGRSFDGRGLPVQIGLLVLGGAVGALLVASVGLLAERVFLRSRSNIPRRVEGVLTALGVLVLLTISWNALIQHNWHRVERRCLHRGGGDPAVVARDPQSWDWECLYAATLGADPVDYWFVYQGFPQNFDDLSHIGSVRDFVDRVGGWGNVFERRPLYTPVSAILTVLVHESSGLEFPDSMFLILAVYASLCPVLLYVALRWAGLGTVNAVLLSAVGGVSFAWLSVFSVPETYSLGTVGALLALASGFRAMKAEPGELWRRVVLHGCVTAVASWLYPPNAAALLFLLGRHRRWRATIPALAAAGAALVGFLAVPGLLYYGSILSLRTFAGNWASPANFGSVQAWLASLSGTLVFSLVSPVRDMLSSYGTIHFHRVIARPLILAASGLLLGAYFVLARKMIRSDRIREFSGPAAWLLGLVGWQVYWDPKQVVLFGSVPLAVLLFLIGCGLRDFESEDRSPWLLRGTLAAACLVLLLVNWPAVWG